MQELGVDQVYIDRMGRKTTERPEFQGGRQWREENITAAEAMKQLDMKPSTFSERSR